MNYLIPFAMGLTAFLMFLWQGASPYISVLAGIAGTAGGFIAMLLFSKVGKP